MAQSEFDKLYEHLEGAKAAAGERTCEYARIVGDKTYCCQTKAMKEWGGFWYCEAHYEWYADRPDLRQIRFTIHENPIPTVWSINMSGVKRLTVNGRFKKRG